MEITFFCFLKEQEGRVLQEGGRLGVLEQMATCLASFVYLRKDLRGAESFGKDYVKKKKKKSFERSQS